MLHSLIHKISVFIAGLLLIMFFSNSYITGLYTDWFFYSRGLVGKEIYYEVLESSFKNSLSKNINIFIFLIGILFLPRYFSYIKTKLNLIMISFIIFFIFLIAFSTIRNPQTIIFNIGTVIRYINEIFISIACTIFVAKNFKLIMGAIYLVIFFSLIYLFITRGWDLINFNLFQMERLLFGATVETGVGSNYLIPLYLIFLSNAVPCYVQGKKIFFVALEILLFISSFFTMFITFSRGPYLWINFNFFVFLSKEYVYCNSHRKFIIVINDNRSYS